MERLTFYDDFGKPCYKTKQYSEIHGGYVDTVISNSDVAQKLAAYEDAEEQEQLVTLPCKEGQRVYAIVPANAHNCEFCSGALYGYKSACITCGGKMPMVIKEEEFILDMLQYLNKTVFLTSEEAAVTLEKLK